MHNNSKFSKLFTFFLFFSFAIFVLFKAKIMTEIKWLIICFYLNSTKLPIYRKKRVFKILKMFREFDENMIRNF